MRKMERTMNTWLEDLQVSPLLGEAALSFLFQRRLLLAMHSVT